MRHPWLRSMYEMLARTHRRIRGERLVDRWNAAGFDPQEQDPSPREIPSAGSNPILDYLARHDEGPGVQKWLHYPEIYHRHLAKFIGGCPVVVEVGVDSGGSLPMWQEYFGPGCRVHGIDIDPACLAYASSSVAVHIGDQSDPAMWKTFRETVPNVDVLVDDGGHSPEQQMVTLEEILPHLRPGGVYICEDVHGKSNRFAEFAYSLSSALNAGDIGSRSGVDTVATTPFQAAIHSVHWYPFLVVIEKRKREELFFSAPLRGSQWHSPNSGTQDGVNRIFPPIAP